MSSKIVPDSGDPKTNTHSSAVKGTRIRPDQPAGKSETPWKGRFDRRKVPRVVTVDFPVENTNQNTGKPNEN